MKNSFPENIDDKKLCYRIIFFNFHENYIDDERSLMIYITILCLKMVGKVV